jgi:hypothetical protein
MNWSRITLAHASRPVLELEVSKHSPRTLWSIFYSFNTLNTNVPLAFPSSLQCLELRGLDIFIHGRHWNRKVINFVFSSYIRLELAIPMND